MTGASNDERAIDAIVARWLSAPFPELTDRQWSAGLDAVRASVIDAAMSAGIPEPAGDQLFAAFGEAEVSDTAWRSGLAAIRAAQAGVAHRSFRSSAAAAAGPDRERLAHFEQSPDGRVAAALEEADDGRIVLTVSSTAGAAAPAGVVVRVRWAFVAGARTSAPEVVAGQLVTPLPQGPRALARYDLGPLGAHDAIDLHPPEPVIALEDLSHEEIETAFASSPYGNAMRAWRELLAADVLPDDAAALVRANLHTD
ncbi:MAG: hypothetical protein ACKVWR_03060 [Acidimicrobiales bacterium]